MFLQGFIIGLVIGILGLVIYICLENSILKRDLLDAVEELGLRQQELSNRKLIGFIPPAKKKPIKSKKSDK